MIPLQICRMTTRSRKPPTTAGHKTGNTRKRPPFGGLFVTRQEFHEELVTSVVGCHHLIGFEATGEIPHTEPTIFQHPASYMAP